MCVLEQSSKLATDFASLTVSSFLAVLTAVTSPEMVTILGVTLAECFISGADLPAAAGSPSIWTGAWVAGGVAVAAGVAALVVVPALAMARLEERSPSVRVQTV